MHSLSTAHHRQGAPSKKDALQKRKKKVSLLFKRFSTFFLTFEPNKRGNCSRRNRPRKIAKRSKQPRKRAQSQRETASHNAPTTSKRRKKSLQTKNKKNLFFTKPFVFSCPILSLFVRVISCLLFPFCPKSSLSVFFFLLFSFLNLWVQREKRKEAKREEEEEKAVQLLVLFGVCWIGGWGEAVVIADGERLRWRCRRRRFAT